MSETWGDRLLYFDTGDQFQGGIEGYISQGQIMMDFFNELEVEKSIIGNHEFDYGVPFLKKYMNRSNFDWIIDNVRNTTSGQYITFPHQKKSTIIEIGGIKLGLIGITTVETPTSTNVALPDLKFEEYKKIIEEESKKLKNEGANAIIVLGHVGLYCNNDLDEVKLEYKIRNKDLKQEDCRNTDEAYILLNKLNKGVIDLFLGGHKHDVSHHWINDIPIVTNDKNGKYAQIIYLPFNRNTHELISDKILFEGPLPICDKLFKNKKLCDLSVVTEQDEEAFGELLNYRFHGKLIEKEENITKIGNKYLDIFNEYDKDFLTFTLEHIESSKAHENALGNLYTDYLRHMSGVDIAVVNPGAFRTPLYRGNITNATIHSFDPFGNDIVKFKAYGWEIKKMFQQLQKGSKGFYPVSGLKMTVRNIPTRKLLSIKLYDGFKETEIKNNQLYTLASNDFCFPLEPDEEGGDDFKKVYQWFRPREAEYVIVGRYNSTRDTLIEYLRYIDQLKSDKYYNINDQRMRIIKE
jgi:2',3'-cyclic-nucleotide 2'-phosphodiesterase (5'-nucleotidase family)